MPKKIMLEGGNCLPKVDILRSFIYSLLELYMKLHVKKKFEEVMLFQKFAVDIVFTLYIYTSHFLQQLAVKN